MENSFTLTNGKIDWSKVNLTSSNEYVFTRNVIQEVNYKTSLYDQGESIMTFPDGWDMLKIGMVAVRAFDEKSINEIAKILAGNKNYYALSSKKQRKLRDDAMRIMAFFRGEEG